MISGTVGMGVGWGPDGSVKEKHLKEFRVGDLMKLHLGSDH